MRQALFIRAFALIFFITSLWATQNFVLKNEDILPSKTINKINEIGSELFKKSGVRLYLVAVQKMPTKTIKEFEKKIAKNLTPPFILLTFALKDKKVDIISSKEAEKLFNKEEVLSPFPGTGSIIPLLTSHAKNFHAMVEAALLNGYADIAERVAKTKGIELKSGLGNVNRDIYRYIKWLFYGTLALIFANFLYRRVKR